MRNHIAEMQTNPANYLEIIFTPKTASAAGSVGAFPIKKLESAGFAVARVKDGRRESVHAKISGAKEWIVNSADGSLPPRECLVAVFLHGSRKFFEAISTLGTKAANYEAKAVFNYSFNPEFSNEDIIPSFLERFKKEKPALYKKLLKLNPKFELRISKSAPTKRHHTNTQIFADPKRELPKGFPRGYERNGDLIIKFHGKISLKKFLAPGRIKKVMDACAELEKMDAFKCMNFVYHFPNEREQRFEFDMEFLDLLLSPKVCIEFMRD